MKKLIFLLISMFCMATYAQNCPFKVRFEKTDATCYNNGKVEFILLDDNDNEIVIDQTTRKPVDENINLMNIKYYYRNMGDTTTHYTPSNIISTFEAGQYVVGVQAVCSTGEEGGAAYRSLDTNIVVTITSSYVTPSISPMANIATDSTMFGNRPTLPCLSTGRVQLNITGGSFPYTIKIVNEATDDTIRTVVFDGPQYTGSNSNNYNYVNYFSFDSLAKGSYRFYFTDGCSFNYNVAMDVRDLEIPVIEVDRIKIYAGLGGSYSSYGLSPNDSNKVLFRFFFKGESYNYYYKELGNLLQYRFINNIAGGTSYTSPWYPFPLDKAASDYYYLSSAEIYIIDTVKTINQYCALYNQDILWEGRSTSCSSTTNYSKTFRLERYGSPSGHSYNTKTTHLSEVHYDPCQFTANDLVHIRDYYFHTSYNSNEWSASNLTTYYWTYPLHYCFIDNDRHDTIKTIDATTDNTVYLYDTDIEDKYGSFEVNDRNINLRWTVTDDQGCVLHDAVDVVTFYHDTIDNVYNSNRWRYRDYNRYYYEGEEYPDYCCQNKRYLRFYEQFTIDQSSIYPEAMRLLRDGCQFKITSSPYDNMYNMTAIYNYDQNKWIVQRENLNNTVELTGEINTSQLYLYIQDYCLPSGEYKYEFITGCDTFRNVFHADFPDNHSIRVAQKPKYTFTQTCDDAYITPIEGQYDLVAANIHAWDDNSNNEYHANDPYETTTPGDAYFKVISGPEGGYPTNLFPLNSPIRFSKPGTYTIRMLSADTIFYCEAETYDTTITYSGGAVEFESAAAYLCEATSTTGNIVARARYGTAPYTFNVYSDVDKQGSLLATNTTGKFTGLPIHAGQKMSIELTDACGYNLYVNLDVTDMSQSQIAWFDGGLQLKESCEGSTIEVYALLLGEDATYHWTGPNGYDKYTTNSTINLPRGSESGYYHIELSAPGCSATLRDSVYLRVITSPSVTISEGPTVCPGEEVTMTFTPSGTNGTIHYVIGQEENSIVTYYKFSGDNGQNESITFNAFANNTLWVDSVKDDICSFSLREGDKVVTVRDDVVSACNITTSSDTICYNTAVDLTATASGLSYPYTIKWYADADKQNWLQTDEIYEGQHSTYHVNALTQDTLFYVTAVDANTCETQYGYVSSWMNMQAGTTTLACGQSKRLFDSGGSGGEYSPNENISHTFTTSSGHITIDFTMFDTQSEDVLKVISGSIASATADSVIAELSGNVGQATYTSNGNTLSLLFISKRNAGYPGWDAIVSCDAKPAQSTVKVLDPVTVALTTSPELPLHYNSDVTVTATAQGGKEESYLFTWFTSTDNGSSWTQAATTSDVLNLTGLTTTTLVKVEVADNATDHCLDIAQEQLTIHIADIALDLAMSCQQAKTCIGNFSVDLTVSNGGTETATNIVCKLNFPSYISYANGGSDLIEIGDLGASESKIVTVDLYNAGSFNTPTTVNIQGQIWSADQGDSRTTVEYGDWDWQRTALQDDEATTSILIPAAARAEDYIINIPEQAVCYGATAEFVATPHMTPPATISWYEDKSLSTLLYSQVLTNPGDVSTYTMPNVTSYKSYYLTIENEDVCPITASVDYSDKLNYYRVTGNVNMHNGTTTINNSDHIRFYDSGGPDNPYSANENYTHTFKATDGSPIALLLDYISYNGSFSVYNGPDILQSLPVTPTETTFGSLYTSATGYITIRYKGNQYTSNGWKGHVFTLRNTAYNEAKASVKPPLAAGHLTTQSSEVCFGATATLTASADIAYPQNYTWYASDMSQIVKEETISSGSSTLQIENATTAQPYYVTVGNESECPVEMPFYYSTVLMNSINNGGTTTLQDKEVVNFFDEGGPNNNYPGSSDRTYTHTFTTVQGQVVMEFDKYTYLCQGEWDNEQQKYFRGDTLYLYDGIDDSAPLLDCITGNQNEQLSFTSTSGSITAKFVINGICGGNGGWKAKVTNSATAPVQSIVLLNSESHNQTTILTPSDSVLFYDEGGAYLDYQRNHDYTHTFTAMQGNVKMQFNEGISLYSGDVNSENPAARIGDTLYIYDGANTQAPLLKKLNNGSNITLTSTGNSLTVRFISHSYTTYSGWKASVTTTNPQASMAEAHISFKSPLAASDVTTSDVEVCYGGEATLTASSTIAYPQYYTWYSSDLNCVLKRDTITTGKSSLKIDAATSAQPYYVSVGNATNCPVEAHTYNTSTLLLNETSNGATTNLHDKDIVNFYDEGGPENYYYSRGNLTHTFTTDEGQVVIDFNKNYCIYLCTYWDETSKTNYGDTLYFYDGPDDSAPLLAQYGSNCNHPIIKSTTNSLTVKLVSAKADGNGNSGWRARVSNSATAVTPTPVKLSVSNHGKTTTITPTDSILFYDEGGEQGSYLPNSDYTHTFTTLQGNVKMTFINCINLASIWDSEKQENTYKDTLFLYDGDNTTAPILAKLTTGCNQTFTSTGHSMTVRFVSDNNTSSGWKASVTDANLQANMAQANITFKAPLDASSITTDNDEVCYGTDATLKASSSIEFPQYYTWYSSDLNSVLKRDTITTGESSLEIAAATSAKPYYVSVGNAANCPVEAHTYNTSTLLLNATSNGATTNLHKKDIVNFYDEGGPENSYSSKGNLTHTFTTDEGQVIVDFNNNYCIDLCSHWDETLNKDIYDSLYFYDGTDDSAPLLAQYGNTCERPIIKSTTTSLTVKLVSARADGSSNNGWRAKVYNSATAVVPSTVLLSASNNGQTTTITPTDSILFYDEGGEQEYYLPNSDYTHTFTALQGNVQMTFIDCINFPTYWDEDKQESIYKDTLFLYDGANTTAPTLAKLTTGCNQTFTSTGHSMTVRFVSSSNTSSGWKAAVTDANPQANMAVAHVSFKAPLDASSISTTNDEVCYGGEATLTASSTIDYPQYYTWYSSNLTEFKRDTITSGSSTLEIAAATSAQPYYVSVENAANCSVEAHTYNISSLLLNNISNGATTALHEKDIVNFYDEGGPENSYYSKGNLIHTFTTDEGQVIIDFNDKNDCINLCSHWDETLQKSLYDSLYFYDGPDDSSPLLAQYGSTCDRPVIKSTTNSLTVKLVSAKADGSGNNGWRARVYNSATAVTPTPMMLSASNNGKTTTITPTDSILFYDEGGEQGNYLPNSDYTHTFTALQGNVQMTFIDCINFHTYWDSDKQENFYKDTLFLYDGANTTTPILAKLTTGCNKTFTSSGHSMTVRFVSGSQSNSGWKASVTDANPQANMAEARITFKTPLDASNITTTNDEVCYGSEATLKASSSIDFPQYFTWYSSDLSKILKRDTINSGVSTFKIDSAISAQPYYVSVGNATNCPVEAHIYNTSTLLLNETSNGATTSLHEKDVVDFYDEGGPERSYHSRGNLTHTFTTDEGQVIIDFSDGNHCINLCSYWDETLQMSIYDSLYFYDGPDDSSPLLAQYGSTCNRPIIKSTTNSLTVKLVSAKADGRDDSGWWAKVYNSATAVVPTTVLLSASNHGKTTTITPTDNILFYDEGGKKGNYQPRCDYSHTFTASQGNVQISFNSCINLASGWNKDNDEYIYDSLYIYDGASTNAPLLARYNNNCNYPILLVSSGTSLTVRLKSFGSSSNNGWEAQVVAVNAEASMAEARVMFRSPINPSSTTTTNDEVCYGQDATLTAQNDHIAYPQYYTWYDKDGATILKRDTLTSEGSTTTLNLTNQTAPTNYYVTVSNDTACAYTAPSSEKIASTILLNATTNGKTSYVTPADLIQLLDDGGDDKNYSTPQDRSYTVTTMQGNITATLNRFDLRENDTMYFYNGTTIDNAHLITALSDYQYGTRISSDDVSMTIRFVAKSEYSRDGFDIRFTSDNSPRSGKTIATVSIKAPELENGLTTTSSASVCYGNDATLSATSTLATPQYFTWYDETFTTVIGRDTVTTDGAAGELLLTNQTENGTYYVTVENATSCPMVNYSNQGSVINFNLDANKDGLTTYLKEGDVLYFYDAGGPDGDYTPNLDVTHTITAPEGSTFSLVFPPNLISINENGSYLCLFPGTEVTDDDEMCLAGDLDPVSMGMAGIAITPEMLESNTNSFTIRFVSGEAVSSGFFFIFKVDPAPTTTVLMNSATNGQTTIVSPTDRVAVYDEGGPRSDYYSKGEFVHTFTATQGTLAGEFVRDGEGRTGIDRDDTLYVYDGDAVDASRLIAKIDRKGQSSPLEFASTGKSLTFRFKVNEGRNDGFNATIHNVFNIEDVPSSKVTVKALSYGVGELTICDNELPYTLGDTTFKVGTVNGTYQVTFSGASANGCDSIATIDLTVNESYKLEEEETIYAYQLPYTWKDTTFLPGTVSKTYTLTKKRTNGCDSTLILNLTVIQCVDMVENVTLQVNYTELPYTWRDTTFETNSVSGSFTFHKKTFDGCDSTVNLTLTIIDNLAPVATPASITASTVVCCTDTSAAVSTLEALNALGFSFTDNDSEVIFKRIKSSTYTGNDCQGTRTTIYEVEDDSHNVTEVTYIQKVNDSIAPALTGTWPANITGINSKLVDSLVNKLYTNNQVKALYNDCHEITVTSSDATTGSDCGWTITRTYTIEDACGNTAAAKKMSVSGFDKSALAQAEKGVSSTGQMGTAADNLGFVNEKGGKVSLPRVTRTGRLIKSTQPTVNTSAISGITTTTALSGGEIVSDGGADLTARGVCWSTQPNPTLTDNMGVTNDGYCTGTFSSELTGLSSGTTYYVRAYATNGMGTSYGEVISFTTAAE